MDAGMSEVWGCTLGWTHGGSRAGLWTWREGNIKGDVKNSVWCCELVGDMAGAVKRMVLEVDAALGCFRLWPQYEFRRC